jgi:3-polyprenyl-4-hydroxybenzoate decarboxylase
MTEPRFVRAPHVRIVDHGEQTTIVGRDGSLRRLDGDSAQLVRAMLDHTTRPITRTELLGAIARDTAAELDPTAVAVIDEATRLLRQSGVLVEPPREDPPPTLVTKRRVVLGLTGAVATLHAPMLIGALQRRYEARVVATRKALRFVGRVGLEALTHHAVRAGVWETRANRPVPHIETAEWAELVVVCPASATTIARIATGSCVDLVSAVAISTRAPVVIVPSMNAAMHANPAVKRNLEVLRDEGRYVVHPSLGVELAQSPDARVPMYGPAPGAEDVAAIVHAVFALESMRDGVHVPVGADGWDAVFREHEETKLPWYSPAVDASLFEVLAERGARDGSWLEIGAGTGAVAIEAARRGFRVTAIDVSRAALEKAQAHDPKQLVTWVLDDVLAPRVQGRFAVVHDRGCLHVLPATQHARYAATIASRVARGGWYALAVHDPNDATPRGTHRFTRDALAALFRSAFTHEGESPTTLGGEGTAAVPAKVHWLRRR